MNTTYETPLAQAIDLLTAGYSLPFALRRTLTEEGYDVLALTARYSAR